MAEGNRPRPIPDTFIVGAPRAGTTSLFNYLSAHPKVSASYIDEPRFFCKDDPWIQRNRDDVTSDRDEYLALFTTGGEIVLEATTDYLWIPSATENIWEHDPDAQIIILLREPIARAHSHYWMNVRHGKEDREFQEALKAEIKQSAQGEYVTPGRYASHLERWLEYFPESQIHIELSDDFFSEPRRTLRDICGFLGIRADAIPSTTTDTTHNRTKIPRNRPAGALLRSEAVQSLARRFLPDEVVNYVRDTFIVDSYERPEIDKETVNTLRDVYDPEIQQLEERLGTDLQSLRRPPADSGSGV